MSWVSPSCDGCRNVLNEEDHTPPVRWWLNPMPLAQHPEQQLLRFRAQDGSLITSYLATRVSAENNRLREVPILIEVHGLLGNFLSRGTPRLLPLALLERGFSSFAINTRLAYAGQMNSRGIFDDTKLDIDAAVNFLRQEGFRNIFILGFSLGASMVLNWAANCQG